MGNDGTPPEPPAGRSDRDRSDRDRSSNGNGRNLGDAYAALSYILSGVLLWGGIGWLVDAWLGTRGFVGAGIVVGAGLGVALIYLRYSKP